MFISTLYFSWADFSFTFYVLVGFFFSVATTFLGLLLSLDEEGAVTVMAATKVYNGWDECFQVKLLKIIRSTRCKGR